jgi:hypothetical protein
MKDGIADQRWWDDLFEPEPEQWGLRGDPYAWTTMRELVRDRPRPADTGELTQELVDAFARAVGARLDDPMTREPVHVVEFAHGGMSSGMVDPSAWRDRILPLLVERGARQL